MAKVQIKNKTSLNPYYNGICSRSHLWKRQCVDNGNVLILIIMEYALGVWQKVQQI